MEMKMNKSRRFRAVLALALAAPLILGSDCDSSGIGSGGVVSIVDGVISLVLGILQLAL